MDEMPCGTYRNDDDVVVALFSHNMKYERKLEDKRRSKKRYFSPRVTYGLRTLLERVVGRNTCEGAYLPTKIINTLLPALK